MMVSIIIPSYNSEKTIQKCLSSLKNQTYNGSLEIILVDSSLDNTANIVRNQFPSVRFIHLIQKTDPGTARNRGILEAKGELLLFLDSDCYVKRDWIEKMVKGHQEYPELSAVGGAVVVDPHTKNPVAFAGYMAEFREFLPQLKKRYTWHIPTLNVSYKRQVFFDYGYFDPNYYPQEDLVFNYRLSQKCRKILFDPAIVVTHQFREKPRDFLEHQRRIGDITAQVLKILPLPGYQIVRHPLLFFMIWPFLPIIKFARTISVFWRYQRSELKKNIRSILLLKLGLLFWISGFIRGVFTQKQDLS